MITPIVMTPYQEIARPLRQLYLEDKCPWLVHFSGGKDSTMQKHRAKGLPEDLLNILKDDLDSQTARRAN